MSRYDVPREWASDVDDARRAHEDVPRLSDADVVHEFARAMVALANVERCHPDRDWLVERVETLTAERAARRMQGRRRLRAAS